MGTEKDAILDRVDLAPLGRINGDPAAIVALLLLVFISQRKDVSSFESWPLAISSSEIFHFGNNATTIASLDCFLERLHSSTCSDRVRSRVHDFVVDLVGIIRAEITWQTFVKSTNLDMVCNNNVISREKNTTTTKLHHETGDHTTHEHERTRTKFTKPIRTSLASRDTTHETFDGDSDQSNGVGVRIEDSILRSLKFPLMNDRYDRVEDAYAETFDWIFRKPNPHTQPWNDFSEWLSYGDGICWINGKAGSGKSTLMRYIYEDPRTPALLLHWVCPSITLLTIGFFFWKSGVSEQASQLGLLRSLLYAILSRNETPWRWSSLKNGHFLPSVWRPRTIHRNRTRTELVRKVAAKCLGSASET